MGAGGGVRAIRERNRGGGDERGVLPWRGVRAGLYGDPVDHANGEEEVTLIEI